MATCTRYSVRVALGLLCSASIVASTRTEEFTQRFRGQLYDAQHFKPTGNATKALKAEPQGLRITMPPDHNSKLPVGFVARAPVRGDFEITMAFDILRVDKP